MDLMQALAAVPGVGPILPYLVASVALSAFVARFLPPPTEKGAYAVLYAVVNAMAQNGGQAANARAPGARE